MAGEIKTLIVDDELLAREIIRSYLSNHPDIEVVAECSNGFDAIKAIQDVNPDLIFLDVQMPKINGFEMLEIIDEPPRVIFSTAYDQYAIDAFEKNAVDYLLKPYNQARFDEALDKARQALKNDETGVDAQNALIEEGTKEKLSRIVVRSGSRINILDLNQILHILATDDYVEIHTDSGKYLKQMTMKSLELRLPDTEFVRTHRSHIISIKYLQKIEHFEKDSHMAVLKDGKRVPISRSGYGRLRELLEF